MHETHFQSQFTAAAVLEYLLHFLQKWSKTPWITDHTNGITVAARAVFAFAATLGITWKYSGDTHELVIGGLSAIAIGVGLWHVISQYAMQHAFGGLVRSGNLDKIKAIVTVAVAQAIASGATTELHVSTAVPAVAAAVAAKQS
jgi:hypothetical protein